MCFGDLTQIETPPQDNKDSDMNTPTSGSPPADVPLINVPDDAAAETVVADQSKEEEDRLLKSSSAGFADWVTSFFRRVIALLENLPEEGASGPASADDLECLCSFCSTACAKRDRSSELTLLN